jgi:type IV pilus assembly protein PilN
MRISVNLATRPFVELRPLFARLRLAMAVLTVMAVALGIALYHYSVRARAEQAQMDVLKSQTAALETERQKNEARMREPQNRAVLERSQFLNDLFATKSFSWTSVMMDLERVVPAGVQVTSIEPAISAEHEVNIRLRVSGDRDRVVDLVRNLERSQRFLAPRPANETAQTQEHGGVTPVAQVGVPGGVQFDIVSGYNPLPPVDKATLEKDKAAKEAPADKSNGTAPKPAGATHKAVGPAKPAGAGPQGTSGKPAVKRGVQ